MTDPLSEADFALARRAVERGLLTPEQVESALVSYDRSRGTRLLAHLPLTPEQLRELETPGRPIPAEASEAMNDPKNRVGRCFWRVKHVKSGGMGAVWRGWDEELKRWVALKFLKQIGDEQARAYFRREAQLAAGLDHPNIAKVYEVGDHEGLPYIAMQFIEGETLGETKLSLEERVKAIEAVAEGVRHAHEKGVIHRDLKPGNVMVDRDRRVYVMDFGLAKETAAGVSGTAVLGTPSYMAPEQARGKADRQSDVYGIGAILYELATGRPPYTGESSGEVLAQVLTRELVWPRKLNPGLPEEVEAIVIKAMEKEKGRRYASVEPLLEDVRAYRAKEPLRYAKKLTWGYVLRKRIRKQPWLWGLGAGLVGAILGGAAFGGYTLVQRNRALRAQKESAEERTRAETRAADEARQRAETEERARKETEKSRREAEERLAELYLQRGFDAADRGDFAAAALYFAESNRVLPSHGATANAMAYADLSPRLVLEARVAEMFRSAAMSPDGRKVLTGHPSGIAREWALETGKPTGLEIRHPVSEEESSLEAGVNGVAYSPDGRLVATAAGRTVRLWGSQDGSELGLLKHNALVWGAQFTADGRFLLTSAMDGAFLWREADLKFLRRMSVQSLVAALLSPDESTVVTSSAKEEVTWWDLESARILKKVKTPNTFVYSLAFHPDGMELATGAKGELILWDSPTRTRLADSTRHGAPVLAVAYALDGSFRVTGGMDGTAHLWRPAWRLERATPLRHGEPVLDVVVTPTGDRVVVVGGRSLRLWAPGTGYANSEILFHDSPHLQFTDSPSWDRFAVVTEDQHVIFLDPTSGLRVGTPLAFDSRPLGGEFTPDGTRYVLRTEGKTPYLLDPQTGSVVGSGPLAREVTHILVAKDRVWTARGEGVLEAWSCADGAKLLEARPHQASITALQVWQGDVVTGSEDGWIRTGDRSLDLGEPVAKLIPWDSRLLIRGKKGALRIWSDRVVDLGTFPVAEEEQLEFVQGRVVFLDGERRLRLWSEKGHPIGSAMSKVSAFRTGPGDSLLIASGGKSLVDLRTGEPIRKLTDHDGLLSDLFTPDGSRVIGEESPQVLRVWDAATGELLTKPMPHPSTVKSVALSPDGRTLVTTASDQKVRLWDAATGVRIGEPMPHRQTSPILLLYPSQAAFRLDGRVLLSHTSVAFARLWDVHFLTEELSPDELVEQVQAQVGLRLGARETLETRAGFAPLPSFPVRRGRAAELLDLARKHLLREHFDDAAEAATAALRHDPDNPWAWYERGRAYRESKLLQRALFDFDQAIARDSTVAAFYFERGQAYAAIPDRTDADQNFTEAIQLDGRHVGAFRERGKIRNQEGRFEAALADFTSALEIEPEDVLTLVERGLSYWMLRRTDEAIADFTEAIRLRPEGFLAYNWRGRLYAELKRYKEAIADYRKAIEHCDDEGIRGLLESWLRDALERNKR